MNIKKGICGILVLISASAQAALVGYGWTTTTLPTKNQELFYMGFMLGFKDRYKGKDKDAIVTVSDKSGSLSSAAPLVGQLLNSSIKIMTGFTTSHDALIASSELKMRGSNVLTLYIGPGHSSLANMGENIYTTGEHMDLASTAMLDFALQNFSKMKGLVISNPEAVFSVNNRESLKQISLQEKYAPLNLTFVSMTSDRILPPHIASDAISGKYQYLIMTAYADECASVLQQLDGQSSQLPILTNSSWGTIEILRRLLAERQAPTYIMSLWVKGEKDSRLLEKRVREVYGVEATAEMSYGYDAGTVIAETLNRKRNDDSQESIIEAFKSNPCFSGTSTGTLCFGKHGGHAKRQLYPVRFSLTNGFESIR